VPKETQEQLVQLVLQELQEQLVQLVLQEQLVLKDLRDIQLADIQL
jgi:hypothetical protein